MKIATIMYDETDDSTSIFWDDEFQNAGWVLRADVLRDCAFLFEDAYDEVMEEKPTTGEF